MSKTTRLESKFQLTCLSCGNPTTFQIIHPIPHLLSLCAGKYSIERVAENSIHGFSTDDETVKDVETFIDGGIVICYKCSSTLIDRKPTKDKSESILTIHNSKVDDDDDDDDY